MVEVEFEPRPLSHEAAWKTNTEIQHLKAHEPFKVAQVEKFAVFLMYCCAQLFLSAFTRKLIAPFLSEILS